MKVFLCVALAALWTSGALAVGPASDGLENQLRELDPGPWTWESTTSFEDFDRIRWEMHVARNEYMNMARRVIAARSAAKGLGDRSSSWQRIQGLLTRLHERELQLRADRLRRAVDVLANEQATERQRLWSAHAVRKDGDVWAQVLRNPPTFVYEVGLNARRYQGELRTLIRRGKSLAGSELLSQSDRFFDGLHWWFRGRYGRGAEHGGLLKASAAVSGPSVWALEMPKQRPFPTDPAAWMRDYLIAYRTANDEPPSRYPTMPDYERRHHYVWTQNPPVFAKTQVELRFH